MAANAGSVYGSGAIAHPFACYTSSSTNPVLSQNSVTTTSLEACLTYCVGHAYFGVSQGKYRPHIIIR